MILSTRLRRGRFINLKHFVNLLEYWSGERGGIDYFYYPARGRSHDLPELIEHSGTMVHLAR